MFSDGFRRFLWKDHLTPKVVPTHRLRSTALKECGCRGRTYKDKGKWAWRSERVTFKHGGKEGQCQFQVRSSMLSLCGVRDPIQAFANSKKAPYQIGSIPSSWLPFWLTVSLPLARPQISSTLSRIVRNQFSIYSYIFSMHWHTDGEKLKCGMVVRDYGIKERPSKTLGDIKADCWSFVSLGVGGIILVFFLS